MSPVSSRGTAARSADVTESNIPPVFKKKADKIFIQMRAALTKIISQATSDVEQDDPYV